MSKNLKMTKQCEWCKTSFKVNPTMLKAGRVCCSRICGGLLRWSRPEYNKKMSLAHQGQVPVNLAQLKEISQGIDSRKRTSKLGSKIGGWNKGKKMPEISGENHYLWITDRSSLKDDSKDRGGQLHREWSKSVKNRDGWKCRISNGGCSGNLISHHILSWRDYPELRYQVNNGITLCHSHHPLKRIDEEKLTPFFQELVGEMQ